MDLFRVSPAVQHPYTFSYPLAMVANEPAKVCLEIEEDLVPAVVKVGFGNDTCDGKWQCGSHIVKSGKIILRSMYLIYIQAQSILFVKPAISLSDEILLLKSIKYTYVDVSILIVDQTNVGLITLLHPITIMYGGISTMSSISAAV